MPLRRFQLSALFAPLGARFEAASPADGAALARCLERAGAGARSDWGVELVGDEPRRELALAALGCAGPRLCAASLALPWIAPGAGSEGERLGAALPGAWSFALAARAEGLDVLWQPLGLAGAPDLGRALGLPGVPLAVIGLASAAPGPRPGDSTDRPD